MMNFPGFTVLGSIDLSDYDYDTERELTVFLNDGRIFLLDAAGCPCCVNIYDNVSIGDLTLFPGTALDLAEFMIKEVNEVGVTSETEFTEKRDAMLTILKGILGDDLPALPTALRAIES